MMWGTEYSDEPIHIKLKIYDKAGVPERVRRDLGKKADRCLKKDVDGYIYEDDVIGIKKCMAWVRSYGSSIIVLEPKDERQRMIESAKERYAYYYEK